MRRAFGVAISLVVFVVGSAGTANAQEQPPLWPTLVIAPGTPIRVHGAGCAPGVDVRVTLGSLHGTGTILDTFSADARGRFSRVIPIPSHGEPDGTASVTADCDNAEPLVTTITAFAVNIQFTGFGALPATGEADNILASIGATLIVVGGVMRLSARRVAR